MPDPIYCLECEELTELVSDGDEDGETQPYPVPKCCGGDDTVDAETVMCDCCGNYGKVVPAGYGPQDALQKVCPECKEFNDQQNN